MESSISDSVVQDAYISAPGSLRYLLRNTRVLLPETVECLPQLAEQSAQLQQRLLQIDAEHQYLLKAVVEEARSSGYQAGQRQAQREWQSVHERMQAWLQDSEGALQELLLHTLDRLLGKIPPDLLVTQLVLQALQETGKEQGALRIAVHPEVRDRVAKRLQEAGCPHEVRADAGCTPASCRIDTVFGSLHSDLNMQLTALASRLEIRRETETHSTQECEAQS